MKRYKKEEEKFQRRISSINLQDSKGISLFGEGDDRWSAAEEMVLLTSVENFNNGNWPEIAKILKKTFRKNYTAKEVQEHYYKTFHEGDIAEAINSGLPLAVSSHSSLLIDHTFKEDDASLKSADHNAHENVPEEFLRTLGYMPFREDFKYEYDQTAEDIIKHLDFTPEDEDPFIEEFNKNMKLLLLDSYICRLNDRIDKKATVKKFRLVEQFYAKNNPSSEKKFLQDKSMFSTPDSIISTAEFYNSSKIPKVNGFSTPKKNRGRLKKLGARRNLEKEYVDSPTSDCDDITDETSTSLSLSLSLSPSPSPSPIFSKKKSTHKTKRLLRSSKSQKSSSAPSNNYSKRKSAKSSKKTSHCDITIEDYPGSEHLTQDEKKLCQDLKLMPLYYVSYRSKLTYVDSEKTKGRSVDGLIPPQMTVAQCARVVNFLKRAGKITNQNLLNIVDMDD